MISVEGLKVEFGVKPLFHDVSFVINDRDRIALVGKNGAGKSTMLKILCGLQKPTAGVVAIPNETTLGYLPQVMKLQDDTTVKEETRKAFSHNTEMKAKLDKMQQEMAERTDYESDDYAQLVEKFTQEHEHYMMMGGENYEAEIERTLTGLGFTRDDFERPTKEFSGGWRMRIELAKILLQKPDVLLLDEPTNHLDIESIQWLEQFLAQSAKAVVLVSHDRAFINNVTNRTLEITCGRVEDYKVKYDQYLVLRKERREQQLRAYENQQKEREFFLMSKVQDDIPIHPDSEMMMVMSHEELLQTIQYREFVDSKGEFAIIKLPDGKMTVVNRQGEQVLEPGDYYDMKLLDGNILFYRPRRKAKCYYDLLAKAVIDDGTNVAGAPQVVNIKGWEFIEYNDIFMSRTQEEFSLPYRPSQYDFLNYGYYMIYRSRLSATGCQVWYYYQGSEGKMRMSNEESRNVCFLRNDYEHVYWLCAVLYGERIVVMDSKEDYYLVDSSLKKTYIGCNQPKNENEDLNFVMPRIGKKYYQVAMLQKKEMEASELLLLHEKSEAALSVVRPNSPLRSLA